jgi:hypothetical protein
MMSPYGTTRTYWNVRHVTAVRGKPDIEPPDLIKELRDLPRFGILSSERGAARLATPPQKWPRRFTGAERERERQRLGGPSRYAVKI